MDRGIQKVCKLPIFGDKFCAMLLALNITTVEFVSAVPAENGLQFAHAVLSLAPLMTESLKDADSEQLLVTVNEAFDLLALFWELVMAAKDTFLRESAQTFGFGLASGPARALLPNSAAQGSSKKVKFSPGLSAIANYSTQGPKYVALTPLMEQELVAKQKWIGRLEAIASEAGQFAKFNDQDSDDLLSAGERSKLKKLILAVGAFRTLATHIRHYERFASWVKSQDLQLYPLSTELVLKYSLFLDGKECGPTVIPSVRAAISWVCSRLKIDTPVLDGVDIKSIELKVIEFRAREVKEAIPIPLELLRYLELLFHSSVKDYPIKAVFIGWVLCLIFASLRFNDGVHVKPSSLEVVDNVLFGLCWQTKVERKRRGTKFAVAPVGLISQDELNDEGFVFEPWLSVFLKLFEVHAGGDRDFWMFEMVTSNEFGSGPISYHKGLRMLRAMLAEAIIVHAPADRQLSIANCVEAITWHSLRVTLLSAAVHAGVDALPVSMQANHANTDLVVKYTRERRRVPLQMVGKLLSDLRQQWAPKPGGSDAGPAAALVHEDFSEDEVEDHLPQFDVQKGIAKTRSIRHPKFHVTEKGDLSRLACNRLSISDCEPLGPSTPDLSVICGLCKKHRTDLWPVVL